MGLLGLVAALTLQTPDPQHWSQVDVAPVFGDGRLRGCALNFKIVQRDNLYFGGRSVGADGSFNIYHFGDGKVGAMLKTAVIDGETTLKPDTAYLIYDYSTNADDVLTNIDSEDAGYRLTTMQFGTSTAEAIGYITGSGAITIGLQLNGGSSAVPFKAPLAPDQAASWGECADKIVDDIRSALDGATP